MGNLAICDLFIRLGADPRLLNHDRQTPADLAFSEGHGFVSQLLSSIVTMASEPETVHKHEDLSEVETAPAGTETVSEHRFSVVQEMEPDSITNELSDLLGFEAEAEPEEFFCQNTGETASGTFVALVTSVPGVSDDVNADWDLDLSAAQISGEGIGSTAAVAADQGAENDFLKVQNRGRQSVKRVVVQTSTQMSIEPAFCLSWAEEILAKGRYSLSDIDSLVACQRRSKIRPRGGAKLGQSGFERDAGDGRRPVSRAHHVAGG
jgi:RNA polymerase primary sigma factor